MSRVNLSNQNIIEFATVDFELKNYYIVGYIDHLLREYIDFIPSSYEKSEGFYGFLMKNIAKMGTVLF